MGVEGPALRRTLGLRTVVSTSAGLTFASSTFLVVVQVGHFMMGDAAWIPILIAGVLCTLAAGAFSELYGMYPNAAGLRVYVNRAFGERASLVISLTYMSVVTIVVGTEAFVLSHVLHEAVPAIGPPFWIFLMLTLATLANYKGLKLAGGLQDVITYSVVASIIVMSVVALSGVGFHVPQPLHTGGFGGIFNAVGVAIFLFVGFEWVTPLADEVKTLESIPRGMYIALGLLVVVYSLVTVTMFATPGRELLYGTDASRQPTPHLIFAHHALGPAGAWCMIVTSLCMSLTTFNAGLMSVSRFIQSMASDHVLPAWLRPIHLKNNTPHRAIFFVYAVALCVSFIVYFTNRYVILVNAAAATESLVYALAAASVFVLRRKEPEKERPFRMRGARSLPAIGAVLFVGIAIGVFAQSDPEAWGAAILLLLFLAAWWLYVRLVAIPRREKIRAEIAARASRRPSRRPAAAPPSTPSPTASSPPADAPASDTRVSDPPGEGRPES